MKCSYVDQRGFSIHNELEFDNVSSVGGAMYEPEKTRRETPSKQRNESTAKLTHTSHMTPRRN